MSINVEATSPNYKNLRYTKKGNQYQKTNAGKVIGSVGMGMVPVISIIKNRETFKNGLNIAAEQIKSAGTELGSELDMKEIVSNMRKGALGGAAALVIGCALFGMGLGAILDFAANKIKAHKADKAALNINA